MTTLRNRGRVLAASGTWDAAAEVRRSTVIRDLLILGVADDEGSASVMLDPDAARRLGCALIDLANQAQPPAGVQA